VNQEESFLIIQTAFIGDVILATALVEKIHLHFPNARIDFLLRKGNESLLQGHPFLREVIIWDKKKGKTKNLVKIIQRVRRERYSYVINAHRFMSSGLITALSGARTTIGFDKNPLSRFFSVRKKHVIQNGIHEIDRNSSLIESFTDARRVLPKFYPPDSAPASIQKYVGMTPYICIAPTSVWFTKQFPIEKWVEFLRDESVRDFDVFLVGASNDVTSCEKIRELSGHPRAVNLAGQLTFLESAALMQRAKLNFVNDSAPMHLCSAVNAPVAAIFCSTVPSFGFGPLSTRNWIIEISEPLYCRPCGLHGYKACPQKHFGCALDISTKQLIAALSAG
jgi:heptosyltransferase-2